MSAEPGTTVGTGPGPGAHEHVRRLVAVHLEDGTTTQEFACETCGDVWFT